MSAVLTSKKEMEEVQYIPHPDRKHTKTFCVVDGDGVRHRYELKPRQWTKVPRCVADMMYAKRKRNTYGVAVHDGTDLENNMRMGKPVGRLTEYSNKYDIIFRDRD